MTAMLRGNLRAEIVSSAGTCVIDANQAGNPAYQPAPQAEQPIAL